MSAHINSTAAEAPAAGKGSREKTKPQKKSAVAVNNEEEDEDEELDAMSYREARLATVAALGRAGYPHKFEVTMTIPQFVKEFQEIEAGNRDLTKTISLAGRVMRIAGSSAKLRFYDLVGGDSKIQVFADARLDEKGPEAFLELHNRIKRGDIVGVTGCPGKSKRGELSIFPKSVEILTPCLRMLPKARYGLKDQEIRYRQRYLDLMINPHVKKTFLMRSKILAYLRQYFTERDFVEVETPLMNVIPGGATARPFVTHHNELDMKLYMRIASELFLKMLVVGGMERVFEIGKNFRNEGIDLTHNPEFTAIEFYMAYADYNDIADLTEHLLSNMVKDLTGSFKLKHHPQGPQGPEIEIDFTPPWPRVSFVEGIEEAAGEKLPRPLESNECLEAMKALCKKHHIDWPKPCTAYKLLDKLCGHFIEDKCINPTFIKDHPQLMSPLAKWHRKDPQYAERCELFVMGREIANFYTELNDPATQRKMFEDQAKSKAAGDDEAQYMDEGYCTALEYGLCPTGGWGLGVDRLVMLLTDNPNIKEVILFPAMRPEQPAAAPIAADKTTACSKVVATDTIV